MSNLVKVQKKNKTNKVQPYWVFVREFRKEMVKKGIYIHNEQQLTDLASGKWSSMSQEEKDKYKIKAKTMEPTPNRKRKLYNSLGRDIEEVEMEKQKKLKEIQMMKEEVKSLVEDANQAGELDNLVLYFIHAISFYEEENEVFPAELALAKFSLKEGIFDDIQIRINPGQLPLGSNLKALENKKLHEYNLPPNTDGEEDYMNVLETMVKFLHPLDKLPIFFCEGDDFTSLEVQKKIIHKIFYESQEDDVLADLKIYPVHEVFFVLKKVVTANSNMQRQEKEMPFPSEFFAADVLKNSEFKYATEGCEYHKEKDVQENCCLSSVRRIGYKIAKYCSDKVRYPPQEGRHFPHGFELQSN